MRFLRAAGNPLPRLNEFSPSPCSNHAPPRFANSDGFGISGSSKHAAIKCAGAFFFARRHGQLNVIDIANLSFCMLPTLPADRESRAPLPSRAHFPRCPARRTKDTPFRTYKPRSIREFCAAANHVRPKKWLTESDATRICVVQIQIRLKEFFFFLFARSNFRQAPASAPNLRRPARCREWRPLADRNSPNRARRTSAAKSPRCAWRAAIRACRPAARSSHMEVIPPTRDPASSNTPSCAFHFPAIPIFPRPRFHA